MAKGSPAERRAAEGPRSGPVAMGYRLDEHILQPAFLDRFDQAVAHWLN